MRRPLPRKLTLCLALPLAAANAPPMEAPSKSAATFQSSATPSQHTAANWITLGTSGGPQVQAERSQIANALVVNGAVYLFDVGDGVQRQMAKAGLDEGNIKAVFVSHHHPDHVASLASVMMTHWTFHPANLPVIGPVGTLQLVKGIGAAYAPIVLSSFPTGGPAKPPFGNMFEAKDLPADLDDLALVFSDENIKVWAIGAAHYQMPPSIPLDHLPQAVSFLVEANGRKFAYTGDSGPSPNLVRLAKGADVFISEVVAPEEIAARIIRTAPDLPKQARDGIIAGMSRNHLTAAEVGRIAKAAGVGKVVLTHFVPLPEDGPDQTALARGVSEQFAGPVVLADDLSSF